MSPGRLDGETPALWGTSRPASSRRVLRRFVYIQAIGSLRFGLECPMLGLHPTTALGHGLPSLSMLREFLDIPICDLLGQTRLEVRPQQVRRAAGVFETLRSELKYPHHSTKRSALLFEQGQGRFSWLKPVLFERASGLQVEPDRWPGSTRRNLNQSFLEVQTSCHHLDPSLKSNQGKIGRHHTAQYPS